jgi:hypothetical protein
MIETHRRMWLGIALLAAVVFEVGVLFDRYRSSLPVHEPGVRFLPRSEWGFGREAVNCRVMDLGTLGVFLPGDRSKLTPATRVKGMPEERGRRIAALRPQGESKLNGH